MDKFKVPRTGKPGPGKVRAHPVIAGGKPILRGFDLLFVCGIAQP